MFRTHYNQKEFPKIFFPIDKTEKVEKAGYLSTKQRVETMLLAGQRLMQSRREMYDFQQGEEPDDNFEDPTRTQGFDMADATQIALEIQNKAILQAKRANEKKSTAPKSDNLSSNGTESKPTDEVTAKV